MPFTNKDIATRSHNNDYQAPFGQDSEFPSPIRVRTATGDMPTLPPAATAAQIETFLRSVFILTP
jgi:hypothetical protein